MRLGELLLQHRLITQEQLRAALDAQGFHGGRIGSSLVQLGYVDLDLLSRALGQQQGVLAALRKHTAAIDKKVIKRFSARAMTSFKAIPLGYTTTKPSRAIIACADPSTAPLEELAFTAGTRVDIWVAPELLIQQCLEKYYGAQPTQSRYVDVDFGASEAPVSSVPPMMARGSAQPLGSVIPGSPRLPSGMHAAVSPQTIQRSQAPGAMPSSAPSAARPSQARLSPPPPPAHGAPPPPALAPRTQSAPSLLSPPPPPPDQSSSPLPPPVSSRSPMSSSRPQFVFTPPPPLPDFSGLPPLEPLAPLRPLSPLPSPAVRRPPPILELELPPLPEPEQPDEEPAAEEPPKPQEEPAREEEPDPNEDEIARIAALAFIHRSARPAAVTSSAPPAHDPDLPADDSWDIEPDVPHPMTAPPEALRPLIDQAEASRMLEMVTSKEQVGRVLGDWLRSTFGCGLVLIVKNDMAVGWKGYFPDAEDLIEAVAVPLNKPSMFSGPFQSREAFVGEPKEDGAKVNQLFWKLLRCTPPSEILVAPVVLGSRTVNLLYAHAEDGEPLTDTQHRQAHVVANDAAAAYMRLIRRERSKGG